jgi:hypothetical protein
MSFRILPVRSARCYGLVMFHPDFSVHNSRGSYFADVYHAASIIYTKRPGYFVVVVRELHAWPCQRDRELQVTHCPGRVSNARWQRPGLEEIRMLSLK